MRRALAVAGVEGAGSILGRLGSALLAAFRFADQDAITTRDHGAPAEAGIRYTCTSRTYVAEPQRLARPGTIVQLRIRPAQNALGTIDAIRAALVEHAKGLELPVRVGADPSPINARVG